MIIKLVHLLSLISIIASTTVVSGDSSQGECPVWFKRNENGSCECGSELGGEIRCDPYKQVVSIMVGYCMSFDNSSQELLFGFNNDQCFDPKVHSEFSALYNDLPTDTAKLRELCLDRKRRGLLCGECMDKCGPSFNSLTLRCLECNAVHAILMCLLILFLITVFYVIVLMFRLNFTSGPMLGYTIFCHMSIAVLRSHVGLYYSFVNSMGSVGSIILRVSMGMSAMWWYFATVFHLFPDTCLNPHMTNLGVFCMEYIFVVYPLFLLTVTYVCIELHAQDFRLVVYLWKPFHKCFAKVRRNWSTSDSIIHAYATFFFLSLSILTFSCFNLLYTTSAYNINGTVSTVVLVYEPTMKSFSPQHLPYAITAITLLVLLGFCPTLFLCLYSTRLFTRCFRLSPRKQILLHIFADAFQCCYKDGLNGTCDFRFLSPVPLLFYLTLALVALHLGDMKVHVSYMLFYSALFLALSIAIAYVKPYKSGYMNFSLCFHSAILGFGNCMAALWIEGHIINTPMFAQVLTFLASLPHLFALMTAVYYILNRIRFTRTMIQLSFEKISVIFCCIHRSNTIEPLPDRLENSYAYRTLPDV